MLKIGSIVFAMAASASCLAQEAALPAASASLPQTATNESQPVAANECCRLVDGTPVAIEVLEPLNSSLLKRGDKFKLRLAEPVLIDGQTVLTADVEGMGEVIHAEKSRGGGKAGELLIAARYLDHRGLQIRLRGLKMGGSGKDNTGAALATSFALGPFAHFVHGREIVIPAGTLAQAKIAGDIALPPIEQVHAAAMPGHASSPASDAIPNPSIPQAGGSAAPATTPETATPQQPVVETTQEPKE